MLTQFSPHAFKKTINVYLPDIPRRISAAADSLSSVQLFSLYQAACGVTIKLGASRRGELSYANGSFS